MAVYVSPVAMAAVPAVGLAEYVLAGADVDPDRAAMVDGPTGAVTTHRALREAVDRVAGGLAARRLGVGDQIAIFAPNMPEYPAVYYGAQRLGIAVTTVNALATGSDLGFQLADSGARLVVTVPAFLDRVAEAARTSPVDEVVVVGEAPGATALADLSGPLPDAPRFDPATHVAALPYSSGTTGVAKGVMLSHTNLVANLAQVQACMPVGPEDVLIGVLPFFHIYGQTVVMGHALRNGASVVTMPRFDLAEFLGLVERHRVTHAYLAPPVILALARNELVDRFDLTSLRVVLSGAAPLDADLAGACADRIGVEVRQGYGMTEASPVTHIAPSTWPNVRGSIGVLAPATEARIVDPQTGADLDQGEPGELLVRGPQVMLGYLGNAAATAATLDTDGWLHTGDVATVDGDGWFRVVDRVKELIKYKGYQVAPAELEALLVSHPQVADACVIPVADEEAGEVPKAFVVARSGEIDLDAVLAYVAERVAPYKRIRLIQTIDEIPKSASGKILRRVLVDRERSAST